MTSNIGAQYIDKMEQLGFAQGGDGRRNQLPHGQREGAAVAQRLLPPRVPQPHRRDNHL
jgi:hypothetical protein